MNKLAYAFVSLLFACAPAARSEKLEELSPIGVGLGGFNYWSFSPFANTLHTGSAWLEYASGQWGSQVYLFGEDGVRNPQFDERGLPRYLNENTKLRLLLWPFHSGSEAMPRNVTGQGVWTVTWQGHADIRLAGGTLLESESSGPATGLLLNGRRVYLCAGDSGHLLIEALDPDSPLTDLRVWLPDPAAPQERSLALNEPFWHPQYLAMLADMDFAFLRFMDWGETNQSPQRDWADRRPPGHIFQHGVLHRRPPADGQSGNRSTGIAFEHMVDLANRTGKDLWINVPHMATDDYVTRLARLIRFGSDGTEPYAEPQAEPVHPPLREDLRVWVEHSNEIWSSGYSFPQGNWAQQQADALGISKAQFNARRASQIWSLFQQEWAGADRLVRVAAIWSGQSAYSSPYMEELAAYGPTLDPAVRPDVVSPTTYFGNGIQDWAYEQANAHRHRSGTKQWFHTGEDFVHNESTGETRPVSKPEDDPYWNSAQLEDHLQATFDEWKQRLFSGSTVAGGGFDTTGIGGGFPAALRAEILDIFGEALPIVSYEGGPSLYTDYLDGPDSRDDGITRFISELNRRPAMADVYRIHLNMARSKGLATHGLFVDISRYGKYGQWGHIEYLGQSLSDAPKWQAVKAWAEDMATIRDPARPVDNVPEFVTPARLPVATWGEPYQQIIEAAGGDVADGGALQFAVISTTLCDGLAIAPDPDHPGRMLLQGVPQKDGWHFAYLRIGDDDGDAAWRVFSFEVVGAPDTLLDCRFSGSTDANALPYVATRHLDEERIAWSGLDIGAPFSPGGGSATGSDGVGVRVFEAEDELLFSVSQGNESEGDSTLASAIADDEYFTFTLTPQPGISLDLREAQLSIFWERTEYHAVRRLAVFTSVGGFEEGAQIYTLGSTPASGTPLETSFTLPIAEDFADVGAPIEFRVLLYGSQWGHRAKLFGVRLATRPDKGYPDEWALQYYDHLDDVPDFVVKRGVTMPMRDIYVAGLDPTDPEDVFEIAAFDPADGSVSFPRKEEREYEISCTTDLCADEPLWQVLQEFGSDDIAPLPDEPILFLRARVRLAP